MFVASDPVPFVVMVVVLVVVVSQFDHTGSHGRNGRTVSLILAFLATPKKSSKVIIII